MHRRTYLASIGGAGALGVAGVGLVSSETTLSDPERLEESPRRRSLSFYDDGEEVANFGADGTVDDGRIDVSTELSHTDYTRVRSLELDVSMPSPDGDTAANVAVVSPMTGDQGDPPAISLTPATDGPGTHIEIHDFDDLADETISTLRLTVDPPAGATTLTLDATIALGNTKLLGDDYTLDGTLELAFSSLGGR